MLFNARKVELKPKWKNNYLCRSEEIKTGLSI